MSSEFESENQPRRIIPQRLDPTYEGEPDIEATDAAVDDREPAPDVLQLADRRTDPEDVADPDDDPTDLPAEEAAMHIVTERIPKRE
jgi:hypothetical protein